MSKTQVDRLGDRLRDGQVGEAELRALSEYRASFAPAYRTVFETIRDELVVDPTGRPAKSTTAIIEKLRRESVRLTQMQDIAGLRIVVPLIEQQNEVVEQVVALFGGATVVDRREKPSHGYRAVHVIVLQHGVPVEVQVRTELQHGWAELSEKLSDLLDPAIKYGGGKKPIRDMLAGLTTAIASQERFQAQANELRDRLSGIAQPDKGIVEEIEASRVASRESARKLRLLIDELIADFTAALEE